MLYGDLRALWCRVFGDCRNISCIGDLFASVSYDDNNWRRVHLATCWLVIRRHGGDTCMIWRRDIHRYTTADAIPCVKVAA